MTSRFLDIIIHLMDDSSPVVLFRTDAQFRILGELYTNPALETTVGALTDRLGIPQATVSREVARLTNAGLLRTRREGNRTLVTAEPDSNLASELQALLGKLYGPPARIREALAAIPGVEQAAIFGSWAARWQGQPGPAPADIDLLVIGEVDHDTVWTAAADLTRTLGIDVNPTIRTAQEWGADPTGFARDVKGGPQVDVTPDRAAEARA